MQATTLAQARQNFPISVRIEASLFRAALFSACPMVLSSTDLLAATYYVSLSGFDSNLGTRAVTWLTRGGGAVRVLLLILVTLAGAAPSWATTYYVRTDGNDSNAGSTNSASGAWRTMQNAANTAVAGDLVLVQDGTYASGQVQFANSGTASQPIIFRAQNIRQAIISSTASSACQPAFSIHKNHIYIEGFRFQNSGVKCSLGFTSANAAIRAWDGFVGFQARNNQVDFSPHWDVCFKSNQDGTIMEDNLVHCDLQSQGPHPTNLGNIFRRNEIWDGSTAGTYLFFKGGAANVQAYNNILHLTNAWAIVRGDTDLGNGIGLGGATGGFVGPECFNCIAYNNVVIKETAGTGGECFNTRGAKDSAFVNNVGINCGTMITLGNSGDNTITTNITIKNNIFYCGSGQSAYSPGGATGATLNYNNFFNCSGTPAQANAITGDPKFVNLASDWHLQVGSPAIGTGTVLSPFPQAGGGKVDISFDRAGVVRTAPWSLGIYAGNSSSGDVTPPQSPVGLIIH